MHYREVSTLAVDNNYWDTKLYWYGEDQDVTLFKILCRQEMVLRDSNLVMGPVSVEEEIRVRKIEAGN